MTNLEKIEFFLRQMVAENMSTNISEKDVNIVFNELISALQAMSQRVADDKMMIIFKNMLSTVALQSDDTSLQDIALRVLNKLNTELNLQSS